MSALGKPTRCGAIKWFSGDGPWLVVRGRHYIFGAQKVLGRGLIRISIHFSLRVARCSYEKAFVLASLPISL